MKFGRDVFSKIRIRTKTVNVAEITEKKVGKHLIGSLC